MKTFKILSVITSGLLLGSSAFGQYSFFSDTWEVNGWINPFAPGLENKLAATVTVNFVDTGGTATTTLGFVDKVIVTVTNKDTGDGNPWTMSSRLTDFMLLKPFDIDGNRILADTVVGPDPDDSGVIDPWSKVDGFSGGGVVNNYAGENAVESHYFGASSQSGFTNGLDSNDSTYEFIFSYNLPFEWGGGYPEGGAIPYVMVRWQSVMYYEDDGYPNWTGTTESGVGGFGGPGWDPSIPEPSEVALLSMLGLGVVLWGRKRFMKKAE